ncbi:MAG: MerR family DNA-binding protein, partial [Pseudomonadota bacterium]
LRETGMPNAEMKAFAALYRQGEKTIPERKNALLKHRDRLFESQAALDRCRAILDRKLARYDEIIEDRS